MKRFVTTGAIGALALLALGCGGGSGGGRSSSVKVVGAVKSAAPTKMRASLVSATPAADEVWAIPVAEMQGTRIDRINLLLRRTAELDGSGAFTLSLEKTLTIEEIAAVDSSVSSQFPAGTTFKVNWLLVLVDSTTAPPTPVSVIELQGDSSYEGMIAIPLGVFAKSDLDLGEVDAGSGQAATKVSDIAGDLSLSQGSLASLARTSRILKAIEDVIRNCDLDTGDCYEGRQSFVFMGDYDNLIDPADYDRAGSYSGYQLQFDVADYFDKSDFDGICPGAGMASVQYRLAPPGDVEVEGSTYNAASPFDSGTGAGTVTFINDGAYSQCFKPGVPLYVREDSATDGWGLQFITGDEASQLTQDMPFGSWSLSRKGSGAPGFTELAQFQFALVNPVDAGGHPVVFVPAVRFDTDGTADQGLTTLHVKWYQWVGVGWVEITDTDLLTALIGDYGISLDDFDGITGNTDRRSAQGHGITAGTTSIDVSDLDGKGVFYYADVGPARYHLDYFGVSYEFAGQSFRFAWRPVL